MTAKFKWLYNEELVITVGAEVYSTETGEWMKSTDKPLFTKEKTGDVTCQSDNYVYLDTDRLKFLLRSLGYHEIGFINILGSTLAFKFNVCVKEDGQPHNTASIAEMLGVTTQTAKRLLNKFVDMNILAYTKLKSLPFNTKVYIMNPHLIKKGKKFSEVLAPLFDDILPTESAIVTARKKKANQVI